MQHFCKKDSYWSWETRRQWLRNDWATTKNYLHIVAGNLGVIKKAKSYAAQPSCDYKRKQEHNGLNCFCSGRQSHSRDKQQECYWNAPRRKRKIEGANLLVKNCKFAPHKVHCKDWHRRSKEGKGKFALFENAFC